MRIRNQYADPHCEQMMPTWSSTTVQPAITQDGRHWKYNFLQYGSLIPKKMSDCLLIELTPASAWNSVLVERSATLPYSPSDGLRVLDVSKEQRDLVGISVHAALEFTPIGMCFIELDEWPILQEVGARIFAADTALY